MLPFLVSMSLTLLSSSQSATIECRYYNNIKWGSLGTVYFCDVINFLSITSPDAAYIDSITGKHLPGYNNDNVEAFSINLKDQVNYFPRGINKFFSNLKGFQIYNSTLKEIHKNDLKYFPKLVDLRLQYGQLEILEENLFEFNPNLEALFLSYNKISHIDPCIFDTMTKLKTLYINGNTCINVDITNNSTAVHVVIKAAKAQCTNSDYSNLEQKIRNLEHEPKNLNSANFKKEIKNLEDEIKNSKFSNFFQENLKDLKAALNKKEKTEFFDTISGLIKANSLEMCSAVESKVNDVHDKLTVQGVKISGIAEKMIQTSDAIEMINKNYEDLNRRFSNLINALEIAFAASKQRS